MMLSIDPGLRELGAARWEAGELVWFRTIRGTRDGRGMSAWREVARAVGEDLGDIDVDVVVYETFRVYPGKVGFQADVLELAASAGALATLSQFAGEAVEFHGYEPKTWTRGIPEIPRNHKIISRLNDREAALFGGVDLRAPGRLQHAIDAVGLGLYHLKRL